MAMPIHEARHNGQPGGVDHIGVGRNRDGPRRANRLESARLDQDDRIFDRLPAGTVDQRAALNRQNLTRHISTLWPFFPNDEIVIPCRWRRYPCSWNNGVSANAMDCRGSGPTPVQSAVPRYGRANPLARFAV